MTADRPPTGDHDGPDANAPVVVGVDHSPLGLAATRLAAREAATQDRPLRIVHAFNWDSPPGGGSTASGVVELRAPAEKLLARAAEAARAVAPALPVVEVLTEGPAIAALLRQSGPAALLVIGDGGLNDCTCVTADATALQIAARAGCSVLIARLAPPEPGTVLAAVDGTDSSAAVLELAFDAAQRHRSGVTVVQARETVDPHSGGAPAGAEPDEVATRALAELIAPWRQRYPAVSTRVEARTGDPATLLVGRSRTAELVVVGARGAEPWRGGLGEIAQGLLHHCPVPVLVAHSSHQLYIQL